MDLDRLLSRHFFDDLVSLDQLASQKKDSKKVQEIDNGINAQKRVFAIVPTKWAEILEEGRNKKFLSPKEMDILLIAQQIPAKLPTPKQCAILVDVLEKATNEGLQLE